MWTILLFIIFLGCNEKGNENKIYERKLEYLNFFNDSFYIQGKRYKVVFYGNEQDIVKYKDQKIPLYAILYFCKPNDERIESPLILRLEQKRNNIFESNEFEIPFGMSNLVIIVADFNGDVHYISSSPKLPIKKTDGEFEAGSTICFAPFCENENELRENLEYEIKIHQNYLSYVSFWFWLLEKRLLNREVLKNDLERIDKCQTKSTRLILKLIGLNLLKENSAKIRLYFDSILKYRNLPELNNPYVNNFIEFFYYSERDNLNKPFNKDCEMLLLNNPLTALFERSIRQLTFLKIKSVQKLIAAFNERLTEKSKKNLGAYPEELSKFIIFQQNSMFDSLSFYIPKMTKYFNLLFLNNYPDFYPGDPFPLLSQRRILFLFLGEALAKLGRYQESNEIFKKSLTTLKPFEYSTFEYLTFIAKNFHSLSQIDSAITYYLLALKIMPQKEDVIEKLMPLVQAKYPGIDPKKWINENLPNINSSFLPEIKPDITIQTSNGNIELAKPKQELIILTFFTTNCKFCIEEMEFLRQVTNNLNFKNVKVFSISNEPKEVIEHFYKVKNFNFPIVRNGSELINYFGVSNYPTTIIIGRDGKISNMFVGYSPETSKYLKYVVESQEKHN